jgi:hypothetical protein
VGKKLLSCAGRDNALLQPQTHILRLKTKINAIVDRGLRADLSILLGQLSDAFQSVGRVVEFDADDNYFKLRLISICSWLETMNAEYGRKYQPIALTIKECSKGMPVQIVASDYLLWIVFWNL